MRAGGCTVTQTLTAEAASVVKHAVALARQRGHAQVTPLHVAATLLAPGAMSLLRRACLKSHPHSASHPLQCRALELCFKVALNRLPTTAGPLMQPGQPSLSNALVAALKRAQAHQRRGCLEQQQQPLLAVKVEMDQLIISILDDPSVSRVMREAGFSSTFIKNNLEDETSLAVNVNFPSSFHNSNDVSVSRSAAKIKGLMAEAMEMGCGVLYGPNNGDIDNNGRISFFDSPAFKAHRIIGGFSKSEDVESVLEVLGGKKTRRSNSVIVGDCFLTTENVVREVMVRLERGDVPDRLKGVQVISPHFSTVSLSRDHVEQKLAELRRTVNSCLIGGSAIIYAGDLRWAVDSHSSNDNQYRNSNYCGVEHICMELGRMLGSHSETRKVWLMATATYETYMRCQKRQPSLETLWGLQAVPVPSGGLSLTLQPSMSSQDESKKNGCDVFIPNSHNLVWPMLMPPLKSVNSNTEDEPADKLNCCSECSAQFESEAEVIREQERRLVSSDGKLPLWLLQCKTDRETVPMPQVETKLRQLRKKWNEGCRSKHSYYSETLKLQRSTLEFPRVNPPTPWWCSQSSYGPEASRHQAWPVVSTSLPGINAPTPPAPAPAPPALSYQFSWSTPENVGDSSTERTASVQDSPRCEHVKTTLALGLTDTHFKATNHSVDSCTASKHLPIVSSQTRPFDPESVKELTGMLAQKVPWQSEADIRAIASAVVESRSGMVTRQKSVKGNTWLMVLGPDEMGKRKMAQALAQVIFGSQEKLLCLGGPCSRGPIHDSIVDHISRGKIYLDKLTQAIGMNPHCVVLLEDMEHADVHFMGAIMRAMERGTLIDSCGREASLSNTIIFMTSSLGAKYFASSSPVKGVQFNEEKLSKASAEPCWGFKLVVQNQAEVMFGHNLFKRKTERDPMQEKESDKRKRMSPGLDLNVHAEEQGDNQVEHNEEAVSDVTQETVLQNDALSDQFLSCARACFSQKFLQSLDKCLVFHASDFAGVSESILNKLHNGFGRSTNGRGSLEVEGKVLERMVLCFWELAPSGCQTFENWVQDVFQVGLARMLSMHTLTPKSVVKLSANTYIGDCLYANTKLPARVEVDPANNS
ncbi:hypothetical protein SUGI_0901240 [Cryptomeria japonica]|uniref:protein SMAX1-LIKE 3 n=1 Tax=Cryptomeria japonica TaxID=3369 RepID=UPI002414A53C|nr:protein SMAX1-LIKE 3 [Cryptomeria japonica]GLJ43381.1 hypothetical protein SUGI_0901240 [Cryptomeria japonica]